MVEPYCAWVTSRLKGKQAASKKVRFLLSAIVPGIVCRPLIGLGVIVAWLVISPGVSFGQACPTPSNVVGVSCTVASGTVTNVAPTSAVGYRAISGGQITADGVTENLTAATTTGGLAESGGTISFDGSTLATTATTTATSAGQIGLRATGIGSTVGATDSTITIGPPNGTTVASNMRGAISDNGASIALFNSTIRMLGGATGLNNHGLVATGTGSTFSFIRGTIETRSRTSYGVLAENGGIGTLGDGAQVSTTGVGTAAIPGSHALFATGAGSRIDGTGITVTTAGASANGARAENGGTITLSDGTQVTTTGAGSATIAGSHALYATGAGSQITGTDIGVTVSGNFTNGARAEAGGTISLNGSTISSASTSAADNDPSSAARALSGGVLQIANSTITATGQRGNGISVQDAGSRAIVSNSNVSVTGTRAPALFVFNGGQATVTASSLLSSNNTGVIVQDAGSSVDFTDSSIRSSAAVGYGLRAITGGAATITGGSVTTEGRDGPALYAANGTITATNVILTTLGNDNAMGALADLGGQITLNGGSITTSGDNVRLSAFPHGLAARNPGGILTANGTSVLTTGFTAMGAVADDGGTTILNGNSITTRGDGSVGLYATVEQAGAQFPATLTGNGISVETFGNNAPGGTSVEHFLDAESVITLNDSSVATHGNLSGGLRAIMAGTVNGNRTTVSTEGEASDGVHARDNGSSVNFVESSIKTTGRHAHGALANSGGLVTGLRTSVEASGVDASALYVAGASGFVSEARFSDSSLSNASGATIGVGGIGNVSLTNSTVGGSGEWLRVATITEFPPLAVPDAGPGGVTDPEGLETPPVFSSPSALPVVPGLANVTVSHSTVIGSAFTALGSVSNVDLLDDSLWIMTGNSNLTNLLNDPSLIQYTPPTGDPTLLSSYKTLTVVNYVGEGGAIGLNTYLGADGSPSDRLIVDGGTITGDSILIVRNTTGPGALTVADGILVVDTINGATSVPTAFTLQGDYITKQGQQAVVGGAFAYTLHYGGVGANATDNNWYLRSFLDPALPGEPLYQPGDPIYEAYPQILLDLNGLPTMQQRVGNRYWTEADPPQEVFCKDPSQNFRCRVSPEQASYYSGSLAVIETNGIWTRIEGQYSHFEPRVSTTGADYDTSIWQLQAGLDGLLYEAKDGGKLIGGVNLHYGRASSDMTSIFGDGGIDTDGYGFGGTLTWLAESGFYIDGQGSVTWFDSDLSSDTAHRSLADGNNGFGYALSVETGKKIPLNGEWTLTPQAQLLYSNVRFQDFTDAFGATVSSANNDSLVGRLGISADKDASWKSGSGDTRRSHLHGIANIYYEFLDPSKVEVSGTSFENGRERLWGGVGVGGSYNWNDDKYSVYAEVSANTSLTNFGDSYSVNGTAGFRVRW